MVAPPRGDGALPVLSGVLLALAFPPAAFLLPSFVALAPLLLHIAGRPAGPAARWSATRGALITGAVFYGLRLVWMVIALADRPLAALPAYLLTVAVLAGLVGAYGWALHYVRDRLGLPLVPAAAVLWAALEWTQGHLGPLAFPWLPLGASLAPFPRLAGAADLAGVSGLGLWLAAVNAALAATLLRMREGRPVRRRVLATALLLVGPLAYGLARAATLEMRPAGRVALIQPNIPEELKLDPTIALDTSLAALGRLTARLPPGEVDLVVWPEVALPTDLAGTPWLVDSIAALSRRAGAPILAGAYGTAGDAAKSRAFNSAFLVDSAGLNPVRYDKRILVPFVERVPFLQAGIVRRITGELRYYGGLERGAAEPLLRPRGTSAFGVLICYESIFPALAASYRRAGAGVLVNITNDAWYGRPTPLGRTTALWMHPAHLVLRAIETRTGIARAANTGFSLVVDPLGRIHGRTDLFTPAVRVETVWTTDAAPPYVRWGDWVGAGSAVAAVLALLGAGLRGRGWHAGRGAARRPHGADAA